MHQDKWKSNFLMIKDFRKYLKKKYNFPLKMEMHTKHFLTDKNPYRELNLDRDQKRILLADYFKLVSKLDLKVINIVINKGKIKKNNYDILNTALTYSIQRIENDLNINYPDSRFIVLTDPGRLGKMRATTRKIQAINYTPSKFGEPYNNPIKKMLEDPLPKDSKESYFIQIFDMISYIVNLYFLKEHLKKDWAKRVYDVLDDGDEIKILDLIKNVLNLKASGEPYGIVHYPK